MKTIGIIGTGFVGTAVHLGMNHAFDLWTYDKAKGLFDTNGNTCATEDPISDLVECVEGPVFVCVPTPMNKDGSCNTSIVESVVKSISEAAKNLNKDNVIVAIKSTVVPGTTQKLNDAYPNISICFNPEFLTERNYIEDFKNQDRIIIGGPHKATTELAHTYQRAYPNVPVTKTSSTIAEMVKYMTNCFLATKVSFANEVKQICDGLGIDYDKCVEYATKDKRLGFSHWAVPGPDGKYGWGGKCFYKDLNGMIALAKELKIEPMIMDKVKEQNLKIRPEKDWEQIDGVLS